MDNEQHPCCSPSSCQRWSPKAWPDVPLLLEPLFIVKVADLELVVLEVIVLVSDFVVLFL
jgi:hypothetical protein